MTREQRASVAEAKRLVREAGDYLVGDGNSAPAVWRLVDAALLAWEAAGCPDDLIGKSLPTGRGARLIRENTP